jgi:hypothetical protein
MFSYIHSGVWGRGFRVCNQLILSFIFTGASWSDQRISPGNLFLYLKTEHVRKVINMDRLVNRAIYFCSLPQYGGEIGGGVTLFKECPNALEPKVGSNPLPLRRIEVIRGQ